jgi:hypothetical protein
VLARHWTEAGEIEPAIGAWQLAGERAVERRAYRGAEQHYREAIAALQTLPESTDRDSRELTLQVALGDVMQWTRGWSAADTIDGLHTRQGSGRTQRRRRFDKHPGRIVHRRYFAG